MAGHEADIIAQREELVADRTNQLLVIAAGEIRTAYRLLKEYIPDPRHLRGRMVKANVPRRMSRAMDNRQRVIGYRDRITIIQPTIRLKRLDIGKAKLFRLNRHSLNPESIFLLRPFNRDIQAPRQFRSPASMIDMAMGDQYLFDLNAALINLCHQSVKVAAGVNHCAAHGGFIPEQTTVLGIRGYGNDGKSEFRHGISLWQAGSLARESWHNVDVDTYFAMTNLCKTL